MRRICFLYEFEDIDLNTPSVSARRCVARPTDDQQVRQPVTGALGEETSYVLASGLAASSAPSTRAFNAT